MINDTLPGRSVGRVLSCSNNIATVEPLDPPPEAAAYGLIASEGDATAPRESGQAADAIGRTLLCRIKGKALTLEEDEYAPLAPGDRVLFEATADGEGLVVERLPRRSVFRRWNRKREAYQALAADIDRVIAVVAAREPAFRPGLVDRFLVRGGADGLETAVVVTKADRGVSRSVAAWVDFYRSIGVPTFTVGFDADNELDRLRRYLDGHPAVLAGHSGVGKSTLINRLLGTAQRRVGEVTRKHGRGRHTTTQGVLIHDARLTLIDTPGIRELAVYPIDPPALAGFFPEWRDLLGRCRHADCLHRGEDGCAIAEAAEHSPVVNRRLSVYHRFIGELEEANR